MSGAAVATRRRDDVDIERDRELVERAQAGDSGAFGDLYLRYFDRLCRFCVRRLGNMAEAEDAAQEAFAKAWKALDRFDGERRFYPWLSVIAANVCTDIVRRRSRSTPLEEPELDRASAPVDGGVEEIVERADVAMIDAALDRISPRHREVLRLREAYEWSYQKIADYQGVEISTIETLLFRARRALRREFMALAEAQGAAAAVLVVFGRRILAPLRRVAHLGGTSHVAKVAKLAGPAGSAEAAVGGAAASAPAAAGLAAAGAAAGTGAGTGIGIGLVAGVVATLMAAGALTALAVSHGGPAPRHAVGAGGTATPHAAGGAGGAGAGASSGAAGTRSAAAPGTSSGSPAKKPGARSSRGPGTGSRTGSSGGSALAATGAGVPALPSGKVSASSLSSAVGAATGAAARVGSTVAAATAAVSGAVSGATSTVKKTVTTVVAPVTGLLSGRSSTTTSTTTTTTLPLPLP